MMRISIALKAYRQKLDMTQEEMAAEIGTTQEQIARIETGERSRINAPTSEKIIKWLLTPNKEP